MPVPDNVVRYAVNLVSSTRPKLKMNEFITNYVDWGAGPRASKNIILASKCHALINGKYSPDIEDVKAVSKPILRQSNKNYTSQRVFQLIKLLKKYYNDFADCFFW